MTTRDYQRRSKPWHRRLLPGGIRLGGGGGGGGGSVSPALYFSEGTPYTAAVLGAANDVAISGFVLPTPLTFTYIGIAVTTADAIGDYDFGVYTAAGDLIANLGPQHVPPTNLLTGPTLQGKQTIDAGLYMFGWTGNAIVAAIDIDPNWISWVFNADVAASVGGTLPASIGAVAVAPAARAWGFALY